MVLAQRPRRSTAIAALTGLAAMAVTGVALTTSTATAAPSPKASPSALAAQSAAALIASKAAALHVSNHDAFIARDVVSTPEGLQYVPYDRTYKGLPVVGGDFVVVTNAAGQVLSTSVQQDGVINVGTTATRTAAQAAAAARTHAKGKVVDSVTGTRQVVLAFGAPRLAYESVVASHTGAEPSKLHVFIDAKTGALVHSYDEVHEGTGTGKWNGPNPLAIDTSHPTSTTWTMTDPIRSGISCRNFSGGAVLSGNDDVWGNGVGSNIETGCVDSLFGVQTQWKMLSSWLGRNGINGSGGGLPTHVGLNDTNAYYDGTKVAIGKNSAGDWISAIDVVGHEYGHAIDDFTPGGIGSSAVAEFTADVLGTMTEWYSNQSASYDPPDYTIGEEVNLVGNGPIRYMYNPSLAGHPNCYSSSIPTTQTHAAAGPGNHWFYLLAEGTNPTNGQPTSTTCNGSSNLVGIGIQTAGKIFYHAMLAKTSGMTYVKYRTQTLTAAKNLTPGVCTNFNKVKAAWDAVSVPAQTADPTCGTTALAVTNPGSKTGVVGTATSQQMTASGGTTPYSWTATGLPAGLSINASTGLISGTPTTAATYTVTATAKDATNATASASFTWTISSTGGGCASPGQKLGNPGFETGSAAPWSASTGVIDSSTGQPARTGSWKAWLDGYGTNHTDTLTQSVAIPAGCSATLSFYLRITTSETTTTVAYDKLTVKAGATTLATYSNLNKNSTYTLKSFNLSSYAGQTITIGFTGVEDSSLQTSFVIDDTSLNVS